MLREEGKGFLLCREAVVLLTKEFFFAKVTWASRDTIGSSSASVKPEMLKRDFRKTKKTAASKPIASLHPE